MNLNYTDKISDLEQISYGFVVIDGYKIILDRYKVQYRESKKHTWKNIKIYNRILGRNNNIDLEEISIPLNVQNEIKDSFKDMLVVLKKYK